MLIRFRLGALRSVRFASTSKLPLKEPKFSESAAFQGKRSGAQSFDFQPFQRNYYESDQFNNRRLFSFLSSLAVLTVYFGWLREASDLDEIWNAPPHILTCNLERKMLHEQIERARREKRPTELLEAELSYIDVKEEAMRLEYEKQLKQRARK
ncbi:unnamed protein product, partial [Mesorhabditis spiculigera]